MPILVLTLLAIAQQTAGAAATPIDTERFDGYVAAFDNICFADDGPALPQGQQGAWEEIPQSLHFLQRMPGTHTIVRTNDDKVGFVIQSVGTPASNGMRDLSCTVVFQSASPEQLVAAASRHYDALPASIPIPVGDAMLWSVSRGDLLINVASTPDGFLAIRRLQFAQPISPPPVPVAR